MSNSAKYWPLHSTPLFPCPCPLSPPAYSLFYHSYPLSISVSQRSSHSFPVFSPLSPTLPCSSLSVSQLTQPLYFVTCPAPGSTYPSKLAFHPRKRPSKLITSPSWRLVSGSSLGFRIRGKISVGSKKICRGKELTRGFSIGDRKMIRAKSVKSGVKSPSQLFETLGLSLRLGNGESTFSNHLLLITSPSGRFPVV